ncbi:hypothetical protein AX16_008665 [Volvariella volvacea WC 439]|nr:hypothetical protein AX16_008665 [Volvariella volvacea WC 439]
MVLQSVAARCRRQLPTIFQPKSRFLALDSLSSTTPDPPRSPKSLRPNLKTAIIVNRSPIVTRTPSDFERAYYAYQQRIRRALHNPFPYDFYFKQGSLLETRFNLEELEREKKAFGPDFAQAQFISDEKAAADKAAVEQLSQQEGEGEILMPRVHEADTKLDYKSLDRKGKRNVYLIVRDENAWRFPQGDVQKGEFLHQAAQRDLYAECGQHMDTWIVSRNPIGVYKPQASPNTPEDIIFFYKAHIMAGQAKLQNANLTDFAWLTKQEIGERVDGDYWLNVKDMLSDY